MVPSQAIGDGGGERLRFMRLGTVYLVGAGPGAPDLLTVRAAKLLARADIVFHDALVHPETIALAARAEIVAVGKRCGRHSTAQRFICKRLVDAAHRHAVVVRLKGGDPMLFGRAQEEIAALEAADVPYEIVPGITAALAAAAEIGTSLTQRGSVRSFTFATPRSAADEGASQWISSVNAADASALYMGAREAPALAAALLAAGRSATTPVAIVESTSLPQSRVIHTTLANLASFGDGVFEGPTMLLIGPQFRARARHHAASSRSRAASTPAPRSGIIG
jgi:uroporphyrin-III C-methyltransferase